MTAVALRAEIPQPSLSRLLNSMSEPRPSTLARLARALGVGGAALAPGAVRDRRTETRTQAARATIERHRPGQ